MKHDFLRDRSVTELLKDQHIYFAATHIMTCQFEQRFSRQPSI
ncbi:hypothetical protein [Neorhodopirellula lusitana]